MNTSEPTPLAQSPLQRVFVIASISCFASLVAFFLAVRPAVERLEVRWLEFLVYAIIPMAVTFAILHRSCWHTEITGAKRTGALLLLSGVIFCGVLAAMGVMACLAWFCSIAIPVGSGMR